MSSQFEDDLRSELRRKIIEDNPYHRDVDGNIDYCLMQIADSLVSDFWDTRWDDNSKED